MAARQGGTVLLALGLTLGAARGAGASGETVTINVGDIPANKTVTIVFNAQVSPGFTGTPSQVSNQGSISGTNFASPVLTDDPGTPAPSDPTITPIQVPTSTAIASNFNPSVFSQPVTFTATVTSGSGTPTGTVNFVIDGGAPIPVVLNGSGQASTTTSALSIAGSPHSVVANFVTNPAFGGSSATLTPGQTVTQAASQTTVGSSVNPSVSGQAVTFTATVTGLSPATSRPATGTVQFNVDTVDVGSPVAINGAGVATSAPMTLFATGSPHVIKATFSSTDANFTDSNGLLPGGQVVNKANTTAAITSDTPDPSTPGQLVVVNYTVSVTAPGGGTPTGNVLVSDGVNSCTGTVAAGTCSVGLTTLGARNITATYQGDGNYNVSPASPNAPHTVQKSDTTTAITGQSSATTVVGESFTVNYTVSVVPPGTGTPTGNVIVTDGVNSCTGTVAAGGCSIALLTVGPRTLTATYQGDATFNASPPSPGVAHTVNKASTTTAITGDSPDPSVFGAPVAVTYTVSVNAPGSGTPTGMVQVTDGAVSCSGTVAAGTCNLTLTSVGPHIITATYQGDASFNASPPSAGEPHTVNKANTTAAITSDLPDPSVVGQTIPVSYSVSVNAPGTGTPMGTVTVTDGVDSCIGTLPTLNCPLTLTTPGPRTLTATYSGDGSFNPSPVSAGEPHIVNKANTTAAITSDTPDPSVVGQPVLVTYTVSVVAPGAGTPTGTVTVTDGVNSCQSTLPVLNCSITLMTAGARNLTATYDGDASFNASPASAPEPHAVNKADTTAAIITDAPDPSAVGEPVTIGYSVTVNAPGAGTPTGNVFVTDGTDSCTGPVGGNCVIAFTSPGPKTLTATYQGDGNFNVSAASAGEPHNVSSGATVTAITSDPTDPTVVGQAFTVGYSVTVTPPGSGTPTGNVIVTDGVDSCTGTVSAGSGSCLLTLFTAGSRPLTATYQGDANFGASPASAPEPHTVNKADTTVAITADTIDPSSTGQTVPIGFSVSVNAPGSGTPTGNVTVTDGIDSCTGTVAAGTCNLRFTSTGSKTLTATYAGDANYNPSPVSAGEPHAVVKGPQSELSHGFVLAADLDPHGGDPDVDIYALAQSPFSSYEVVVDGASGDIQPLSLDRVAADGTTVVQSGSAVGTGASYSLSWVNDTASSVTGETVRVSSGGCTTTCAAADVYRIRAYETTMAIARFNNAATQTTILVLQNTAARTLSGTIYFWNGSGGLISSLPYTMGPRGMTVINTATVAGGAPGVSGSITVTHDGSYGDLSGKAATVDPNSAVSFDTYLTPRAR